MFNTLHSPHSRLAVSPEKICEDLRAIRSTFRLRVLLRKPFLDELLPKSQSKLEIFARSFAESLDTCGKLLQRLSKVGEASVNTSRTFP